MPPGGQFSRAVDTRRAVQSVQAHRLSHPSVAEAHAANAVDTFADFRRVVTAIPNPRLRPSLCNFGQPTAYLARVSFESEAIEALNKKLNTWEQVKKFAIIDRELSIEAGDLTPSLKLRRKVVLAEFADQLAALYT